MALAVCYAEPTSGSSAANSSIGGVVLSKEENELLCRVGPGTPMGNLMRQYWIPALPSSEFPAPDCAPKRMRLLGENLVMLRDSRGRVGAMAEACPHRGASLYFARNEDCGLRCSYHGWKFAIDGACVDLPTEPDSNRREAFRAKIRARAYPCRDVNHMVWIYMGSRVEPPPFPQFEINTLAPEFVRRPSIMMEEANWLQNLEGDLDSAHLDWVHRRLAKDSPAPPVGWRGLWNPDSRAPRLEVVTTEYGAFYAARRSFSETEEWHRINQFIFPFHCMIAPATANEVSLRSFVPIDDHHTMMITQHGQVHRPISERPRMVRAIGRWLGVRDNAFDDIGRIPRAQQRSEQLFSDQGQQAQRLSAQSAGREGIDVQWNPIRTQFAGSRDDGIHVQ